MGNYGAEIAKQFGANSTERATIEQKVALLSRNATTIKPHGDALAEQIQRIVSGRRLRREDMALATRLDDAHKLIAKIAKETGVPHVKVISSLTDKALEEMNGNGSGDSDAADEGDGNVKNDQGDAGKLRSIQSRRTDSDDEDLKEEDQVENRGTTKNKGMVKAKPAHAPSPVDSNPQPSTPPAYLARHAASHPSTNGLLLNVRK